VSPHVILQDGEEETAIRLTDNALARVMLTLSDHYPDQIDGMSAFWRLEAIGPLIQLPELDPWVRSRSEHGYEIDETIFLVAATAPLDAKGMEDMGLCRRSPPLPDFIRRWHMWQQAEQSDTAADELVFAIWPETSPDDWCGEWQPQRPSTP
jgi:hypothetical protein